MFSTPTFNIYPHQSQENNTYTARKPGVSNSARKPLGDRAVNEASNAIKSRLLQPRDFNKPTVSSAKKVTLPKHFPNYNTVPTRSFRDVQDNYEDILPISKRIQPVPQLISLAYPPKTPPLTRKNMEIEPMFLELPQETIFNFPDEIDLEAEPIEDPEFPDFDFLLDAPSV